MQYLTKIAGLPANTIYDLGQTITMYDSITEDSSIQRTMHVHLCGAQTEQTTPGQGAGPRDFKHIPCIYSLESDACPKS